MDILTNSDNEPGLPYGIVALVGPESTGKTTLAKQLSKYFGGIYVPEFSRTFLNKQSGLYSPLDLIAIAKGQFQLEDEAIRSNVRPVLCDTDAVVVMVWHEFKYGKRNMAIEELFHRQPERKYLLTYPDLIWRYDPLRENPNDLHRIFDLYVATLERLHADYAVVRGAGSLRFENALVGLSQ